MSGYNGFSMSNNAVAAYDDGLLPASKIKAVTPILIERFCRYAEWHHSSKAFNRVKFYDPDYVLATFGLIPSDDHDANDAAVTALAAHKAEKKSGPEILDNCTVEWIEWTGSLRRPKATERKEEGCMVAIKGQTATITTRSGEVFVKRLSTRGFSYRA